MAEFSNRNLNISIKTFTKIYKQYEKLLNDLSNLQENIDDYLDDIKIDENDHKIFIRLIKNVIILQIKYNTFIVKILSHADNLSDSDKYYLKLFNNPIGMDTLKLYDESVQNTKHTIIDTDWIIYHRVSILIYEITHHINLLDTYYYPLEKIIRDRFF